MSTPMFDQYNQIKSRYRDAILLFRLGDFYEMFGNDAREGSRILGLTLTQRQGKPMCGVPHHAAHGYIGKLLHHGRKVAICEQTSPPDGKSLTSRDVVEVLSPGSVFDADFLEPGKNNYLLAVGSIQARSSQTPVITTAACDVSVGELVLSAFSVAGESVDAVIRREVERLDPGELLVQESLLEESPFLASLASEDSRRIVNRIPDWGFDIVESHRVLTEHLGVRNLHGFGFDSDDPALFPAAAILEYLQDNARHALIHLQDVRKHRPEDTVILDDATARNLEIVRPMNDENSSFTLLGVLDFTRTPMGSRRLRQRLLQPSRNRVTIKDRLDRVDGLYRRQQDLQALRERLGDAYDLERLIGRLGVEKAHPKDLLAIAATIDVACDTERWIPWLTIDRDDLSAIADRVRRSISPDAPVSLNEGGIFLEGYDEELDRLCRLRDGNRDVLEEYLQEQREETGISSLKIKYNRVLGHFFEVPKGQVHRVPEHYIRRQSISTGERYTTPRLSDLEEEIQNATAAAVEREQALFLALRRELIDMIPLLQSAADGVAEVDTVAALAQAATIRGYRRPELVESPVLRIRGGRHPVVEAHLQAGEFVANDIDLGGDSPRFALITGPNMAGKSTVLRQTALIALMAHAGSFVPADEAEIGLCDRIFCRVGASDNIARGESTFLVEMHETSNILRNAGESSLIIMDEVGRGTSTHDGLSIAWAVCEYLLEMNRSRTLFATHYHELARIVHAQFISLGMAVEHSRDRIHFLKRLVVGGVDRSYGVDVARLAGLPETVVHRARTLLEHFETHGTGPGTPGEPGEPGQPDHTPPHTRAESEWSPQPEVAAARGGSPPGGELFLPDDLVTHEIRSLRPDTITPRDALDLIYRWKNELTGPSETAE
jgi:DNA mismatch repair protein MutS